MRHKQQTSGRLRTANNTIVKCFFQVHAPGKCFISSIVSKFWWYTFHRQHKPPSSPEQRIFPLIFIATIRQIFCLSPHLLMRIRCQFFPSWIPFEHSNFSLRLQPHSPIKPDWSDLRDLNFDCIQFSGFRTQWCNARSSLHCPCTIDWQFSRPARLIFPSGASRPIGNIRTHRMRVGTIFVGLPGRLSLSPLVSPSRAPVLSCAHCFQAPATQASFLLVLPTTNLPPTFFQTRGFFSENRPLFPPFQCSKADRHGCFSLSLRFRESSVESNRCLYLWKNAITRFFFPSPLHPLLKIPQSGYCKEVEV